MEKKKSKFRLVHFLAIIRGVLLLLVGISFIMFLREKKDHERRVALGEIEENEYVPPKVYYRSDLEEIVGVRLQHDEIAFCGYHVDRYSNTASKTWTVYDGCTFYIFDTEKHAYKALDELKESSFSEITDEGGNYVRGWLKDVWDARIESYYYVHGNLMVTAYVTVIDENPRWVDEDPPVNSGRMEAEEIIALINESF